MPPQALPSRQNACAKNAVAGATLVFKSCFIFFSLCVGFQPWNRHGMSATPAPSAPKKAKEFSVELNKRSK